MRKLDEILSFLEERMNYQHIKGSVNKQKNVCNYSNDKSLALKISFPKQYFEGYPYSEAFDDMEKMMCNELLSFIKITDVSDDTIPMIRANLGVGIMPSFFGANCRIINNNLPWVDPFCDTDAIRRLVSEGIPATSSGFAPKIFNIHEFYAEKLSKYPKCQELIPIYHPDFQGPFDVAHLIWGPDIYYALYDEAELVHEFLSLITDTYIYFLKEFKRTINDVDGDYCYHWHSLFKGKIVIRNDSAINISRDMYNEFVRPYDQKILDAFGGGSIHFCGRGDQWFSDMLECRGLGTMNFGQPPKLIFGLNFLEKIYPEMHKRNISNSGYIIDKNLLDTVYQSDYLRGISFDTKAEDINEAVYMSEKYCR